MTIRYEKENHIAIFTLDNPKVNALTPPMHKEFYDHMQTFLTDKDVHVGILTGAGKRAFCGGDDIKNDWSLPSLHDTLMAHFRPSKAEDANRRPGWEREMRRFDRFKPIVAAINGPAMGMGFIYLMLHTDIRVATPNAILGLPEIKYGMGGASGSTQLWRHLPIPIAMSMLLTGDPLSAEDALKFHLINEIVEPESLMERALQIAGRIAALPPLAVSVEMEAFYRSMELSRQDNMAYMNNLYRLQRAAYLTGEDASNAPLAENSPEQKQDE